MDRSSKGKAAARHSSAPAPPAGDAPGLADSGSLESAGRPAGLNDRWMVLWVCIFLAVIVWTVFGQTLHYGFVFDDEAYVYENPEIVRGLTLQGIVWAFTHVSCANWHPLTWISHMADCQFYGLNPGGHHLTNILLHTATTLLLFLGLRRMTGALWRSAFVAAVFAIHPLRLESVAWVAERKDVLSGMFFMLTIGAYVRYAEESKVGSPKSKGFYGLTLVLFALGLMSKPMLVTLPFVLLLLDWWPLRRFKVQSLVWEKLPLIGLAAASCAATLFAQTEAIQPLEKISLPLRAGNALISYVAYLGQMFWPSGLAVFYPFTAGDIGVFRVVLSLVLLVGISTVAFVLRRRCPWLLTGWLWYLIMLVPVIGMVQVGLQARADRYTYLPQIGLYVLLTWAAADLCAGRRNRRWILGGLSVIILVALICRAFGQASCWRNNESLWTHTLACTSDNAFGHNALGNALLRKGKVDEAIAHFQKALQIKPDSASVHNNLAIALLRKGKVDEAITHFQKALQIKPDDAEACDNLAIALFKKGKVDEAITHFQEALQIKPDDAKVQNDLAWALAIAPQASLRNGQRAVELAQRADQLAGGKNPIILRTLAAACAEAGRFPEAVEAAQHALQLAETQSNPTLADSIRSQLKLYQAGIPFHLH